MSPLDMDPRSNPYTRMLSNDLQREGITSFELSWTLRCFRAADIVHFHWPNEFFGTGAGAVAWLKCWLKIVWLEAFRFRRGVVVWTVHNVWPHDQPRHWSRRLRAFLRNVDGAIFLSETSKAIACRELPAITTKALAVIPKGHYKEIMVTKSEPLRSNAAAPIRIGNFGFIRPYKNIERLIRTVSELPESSVLLTIAGKCAEPALKSEIERLSQGRENIRLRLQPLSQEDLERVVDDCDAIVLPYRDILNSGAALFALSRGRPVMVPDLGSIPELKRNVGEEWVFTYSGDFTAEKLKEFLCWVRTADRPPEPDLSIYDCSTSTRCVIGLYRSLLAGIL